MDRYGNRILRYGDSEWKVIFPWKGIAKIPYVDLFEVIQIVCSSGLCFQAYTWKTSSDMIFTVSINLLSSMNKPDFLKFLRNEGIQSIKYFIFSDRYQAERFVDELNQKELVMTLKGNLF